MNWLKYSILALALASTGTLTGCPDKKGPAEKAGEKLDNAAEEAGDKVEEAADEVEDKLD